MPGARRNRIRAAATSTLPNRCRGLRRYPARRVLSTAAAPAPVFSAALRRLWRATPASTGPGCDTGSEGGYHRCPDTRTEELRLALPHTDFGRLRAIRLRQERDVAEPENRRVGDLPSKPRRARSLVANRRLRRRLRGTRLGTGVPGMTRPGATRIGIRAR